MPAKYHDARPGPHRSDGGRRDGGRRTVPLRGAAALCADPGPKELFPPQFAIRRSRLACAVRMTDGP